MRLRKEREAQVNLRILELRASPAFMDSHTTGSPLIEGFLLGRELQHSFRPELEKKINFLKPTSLAPDTLQALSPVTDATSLINPSTLFSDQSLLNWGLFSQIFEEALIQISKIGIKVDHTFSENDQFAFSRNAVKQAAHITHQKLDSLNPESFLETYAPCFANPAHLESLKEFFRLYKLGEYQLVATVAIPFLESFLGDWIKFETKNTVRVPRRMAELLDLPELSAALTPIVIFMLKISIGPPPGLNIRNLVWHGFFSDGEYPPAMSSLILILCCDICSQQKSKLQTSIPSVKVNMKEWMEKQTLQLKCDTFDAVTAKDFKDIETLLYNNFFVLVSQRDQWKKCFQLFEQKDYFYALSSLLPLLEHSIRRVYAAVNECPERVVTARVHALMTTLDVLLEPLVPGENEDSPGTPTLLLKELGDPFMFILYDFFMWRGGLRFRDLIAHGVTDGNTLPIEIAHSSFALAISFCLKYSYNIENITGTSRILNEAQRFCINYTPLYHPKTLHVQHINQAFDKLIQIESLIPTTSIINIPSYLNEALLLYKHKLSNFVYPLQENQHLNPTFEVFLDHNEEKKIIMLDKVAKNFIEYLQKLSDSYSALSSKMEGNPNKTQKKAFSFLSQNLPLLSRFGTLIFNILIHGFFLPLTDEMFKYHEALAKVGGVFMSRAAANKYTGIQELVELAFGIECDNPNISPRERVLVQNILNPTTEYLKQLTELYK